MREAVPAVPSVVESIAAEYRRYRTLAERALGQLSDDEAAHEPFDGGNSVATLMWHVGGNLASRFTDFLTSDGEKPWRDREGEFAERRVPRDELVAHWRRGWGSLAEALDALDDTRLADTVTIRRTPLSVIEALHRSLAHVAYHVGQIVLIARSVRGERWEFLSIPPGGSDAYNRNPTMERADLHTDRLDDDGGR